VEKLHTVRTGRKLKKGVSVDDSKVIDNTITKIGLESSAKHEDIYDSSSDSDDEYAKS
jgi:hypothetical protein